MRRENQDPDLDRHQDRQQEPIDHQQDQIVMKERVSATGVVN